MFRARCACLVVVTILLMMPPISEGKAHAEESIGDALERKVHNIRKELTTGTVEPDRQREAAMVAVWAHFYHFLERGDITGLGKLVKMKVGSADTLAARLRDAIAAYEDPGDSYAQERGSFFSAYTSSLDKSPQIYHLYVPESYAPLKPCPLLLRPRSNLGHKMPSTVGSSITHIVAT